MKNKQKKAWSFAIAITLATMLCIVAVIGCKDEPDPPPNDDNVIKERSTTITLFEGKTATVKGEFDKVELDNAANKIKTALNNQYQVNNDDTKAKLVEVFGQQETIVIIVEVNTTYAKYSTTNGGKIIRINSAMLNDASILEDVILTAVGGIIGVCPETV